MIMLELIIMKGLYFIRIWKAKLLDTFDPICVKIFDNDKNFCAWSESLQTRMFL
jgi:hypothetical protein